MLTFLTERTRIWQELQDMHPSIHMLALVCFCYLCIQLCHFNYSLWPFCYRAKPAWWSWEFGIRLDVLQSRLITLARIAGGDQASKVWNYFRKENVDICRRIVSRISWWELFYLRSWCCKFWHLSLSSFSRVCHIFELLPLAPLWWKTRLSVSSPSVPESFPSPTFHLRLRLRLEHAQVWGSSEAVGSQRQWQQWSGHRQFGPTSGDQQRGACSCRRGRLVRRQRPTKGSSFRAQRSPGGSVGRPDGDSAPGETRAADCQPAGSHSTSVFASYQPLATDFRVLGCPPSRTNPTVSCFRPEEKIITIANKGISGKSHKQAVLLNHLETNTCTFHGWPSDSLCPHPHPPFSYPTRSPLTFASFSCFPRFVPHQVSQPWRTYNSLLYVRVWSIWCMNGLQMINLINVCFVQLALYIMRQTASRNTKGFNIRNLGVILPWELYFF